MRTTIRALFLSVIGAVAALDAQTARGEWAIGGTSRNSWPSWSELNILVDDGVVPGSLQPLELRPDENILPYLYSLYPFERRTATPHPLWVDGMPRM